jgi:hypothetical protein
MSNDDREAPRWGERTPEPEQGAPATTPLPETPAGRAPDPDQPRYGERVAPGSAAPGSWSAPSSATDSGQPHGGQQSGQPYGGQQYGQPHGGQQYGQQHDGQQQGWGQPASGSAQGAWSTERAKRRRTVGVIAFIAGIAAIVLGIVAALVLGGAFAGLPGLRSAAQSGDSTELQHVVENDPKLAGPIALGGVLYLVGTVLGLWAIVQGIVATITARGRAYGIIALVLGVVAPIVSIIVLTAAIGSAVR